MMEQAVNNALSEAIRQVPSLVVLAAVVWMFIRVIFRFIKHIEDRSHIVQKLHEEHMEERQASRKVMSDIATSLNTLTLSLDRFKAQE